MAARVSSASGCGVATPGEHPVALPARHDQLFFVDSRVLVREGLRALAEQQPDFVVVGGSASATLGTAYETSPDVVVADVDLPDAQGADAIALLRKEFPEAALLVLTLVDHPAKVQQVLEAGADGYMLKTAPTSEFFFGIRAVAHGETYLQPSLGVELARWHGAPSETTVYVDQLTPKELEVLRLARARAHELRDRGDARREPADGRGATGAHPAEARPAHPGRVGAVRTRSGHRGLRSVVVPTQQLLRIFRTALRSTALVATDCTIRTLR